MLLRLPLAVSFFFSTSLFSAPIFQDPQPRAFPAYDPAGPAWPWIANAGDASATASADLTKPGTRLTRYHFGQNTSWWSRTAWNLDPDRIAKARQAGIAFWRFPGGSSSDFYFWNHQYGKYAKAYNGEDSARMAGAEYLDFDHFMELCQKTGAEPILTLNYGLARYGSLQEALDLATGWIRYAKQKGYAIRYVEIGNENYGNWEGGSDGVPGKERLTGEEYGKDVVAFVKALKKIDPKLKVGAVVVGDDDGSDWVGFRWWNKGVMTQAKDAADFWVVHEYFLWPYDNAKNFIEPPYEKLLGNLSRVGKIASNLNDMQDRYVGKRLPVAFDEFNIINASPHQTIETVNLLFTAGALGEMLTHGFAAANAWDWKNGLDEKQKGDHGMLSEGDKRLPDATPRPSYYAYVLWKRGGGERLLPVTSEGAGLRAYASSAGKGQAGWILINETEKPLSVALKVKGYRGTGKANAWCARGWGFQDLRVRFNEQEGPAGGGGPFPLEGIAPYTLSADGDGLLKLSLPGSSASAVVLY